MLNANGITALNATNSGFYVSPVRNDTGNTTNQVYYNTSTKELTYAVPSVIAATYTTATKPASGVAGQMICITNSPTYAGRLAYWCTTATAAWRYVDDNTAV